MIRDTAAERKTSKRWRNKENACLEVDFNK